MKTLFDLIFDQNSDFLGTIEVWHNFVKHSHFKLHQRTFFEFNTQKEEYPGEIFLKENCSKEMIKCFNNQFLGIITSLICVRSPLTLQFKKRSNIFSVFLLPKCTICVVGFVSSRQIFLLSGYLGRRFPLANHQVFGKRKN